MKHNNIIIPAQIRAGRALLGWSQEHLAKEAEVGLSTVRDAESARRAAETAAVASIRSALWNGGVVFTGGLPGEGPGVRLVADQPNIIRRPSTMQWEEMCIRDRCLSVHRRPGQLDQRAGQCDGQRLRHSGDRDGCPSSVHPVSYTHLSLLRSVQLSA